MKSRQIVASIILLACVLFATGTTTASEHHTQFPATGTPYAEARKSLLKQGLTVAHDPEDASDAKVRMALRKRGISIPEKLSPLDPKFREINCGRLFNKSIYCRALFLESDSRGWRNYVIVQIDPKDKTIVDTRYPSTVDGLPSIPPPLAADVPQLRGSYLKARNTLRALGFKSTRNHWPDEVARVCTDKLCHRTVPLPEAQCAGTGMAPCFAYWISPNNRVLRVNTMGERPQVYFVEWSTWKDLHRNFGK